MSRRLSTSQSPVNCFTDADIQNYLGYAYRRLGQLDAAAQHYQQALTLNSRHRGAHAHLGEYYLIRSQTPSLR